MKIVVKYERLDFFGNRTYTEDKKNNATLQDLKKAFSFLKRERSVAIGIDDTILFWENGQNFEYGTLTAREYEGMNYKEYIWSFDGCKKYFYDQLKVQG